MEKQKNGLGNVFYIIGLIGKANPFRIIATLCRIVIEQVFYVFFFVYLTQYIFTAIETGVEYKELLFMVTLACILHIGIHIMSAWYTYYTNKNDPKIYQYIFKRIIGKTRTIPLEKFEQPDFYDKFTRALDEAIDRAFRTLDTFAYFVAGIAAAVGAMFVVAAVDPWLLVFTIPPVIINSILGMKCGKLFVELNNAKTRNNRIITYTKRVFYEKKYAGEIRLYNIREILFRKHRDAFNDNYKIDVKLRKKIFTYSLISYGCFWLFSFLLTVLYIVIRATRGDVELIAPYIAMINGVSFVSDNLLWAVESLNGLFEHNAMIQNLRGFLEHEDKADDSHKLTADNPVDDITLDNVSFTYRGAENPTINGISLHIHKGEKIALVGHNGAGKTTIVKLIMGLYDVTSGSITAGGHDIREYRNDSYHSKFGVVFQDFQIFALPLAENVLMKQPENEEERERVKTALIKAQFGEKLEALPDGINTMVTKEFDENGMGLSGGEAQKIAIARVFAKDCDVAILDEPSSTLDPIAEYNMYCNMMEAAENKTVIFISHRLSSARMADKIYMLEQGRIIESGTHSELMALNGKYAEMFNLQAKNYREQEVFSHE